MNQLLIVTNLPRWVLEVAEDVLGLLAALTGHETALSSVREVRDDEPEN